MAVFALVQLLTLFVMGGLPLGIPPLPEDPLLAKVAPEKCLLYVTWSGTAEADAESGNQTEQLLAEPEVQALFATLSRLIDEAVAQANEGSPPEEADLAQELVAWGKRLPLRPTAFFITSLKPNPGGPPDVNGGVVVNLGEDAGKASALLDKLSGSVLRGAATPVEVAGTPMFRVQPDPSFPTITFGVKDEYLYVGAGEGSVEGMFERVATDPPAWLTKIHDDLAVPRRANLVYVNAAAGLELVRETGDPDIEKVFKSLGLSGVTSLVSVTGLDDSGTLTRTQINLDGAPVGLLAPFAAEPLTAKDLHGVPADATLATVVRLDLDGTIENVLKSLDPISPEPREEFESALRELGDELGLDLRGDLLKTLGDRWCVYHSSREGGLFTGFLATVTVRDRMKLEETQQKLLALVKAMDRPVEDDFFAVGPPRIGETEFAGHTIFYLSRYSFGMPFAPAWCVTGEELIVALFPQNIKAYLSRGDEFRSLADVPEVADALAQGNGPVAITYQDVGPVFELLYPWAEIGGRILVGALQEEGIDVDIDALPSGRSIRRHLAPSLTVVTRSEGGIEITSRRTIPGMSITSVAMVAGAAFWTGGDFEDLLDGLASVLSPAQARKQAAMNNLRQIGLALHTYHDVHRGFPAAVSTDDDGKPLLSWRVQILPYIEQDALYKEFHLDEPWDSEHNKALVEKMPKVFAAPGSEAGPGMTSYLTVRGEKTIFPGTKPISLAGVLDGTSNTIMVVEASDKRAVTWTKPDDYEFDDMSPMDGLLGLRPRGFLALFGDAHVQLIPEDVDKDSLIGLYTRDGGEPIDPFEFDERLRRRRGFGAAHRTDVIEAVPEGEEAVPEDLPATPDRAEEPTERLEDAPRDRGPREDKTRLPRLEGSDSPHPLEAAPRP